MHMEMLSESHWIILFKPQGVNPLSAIELQNTTMRTTVVSMNTDWQPSLPNHWLDATSFVQQIDFSGQPQMAIKKVQKWLNAMLNTGGHTDNNIGHITILLVNMPRYQ